MKCDNNNNISPIEKANERWNIIHSHHERDKIKYDDWLESFRTAIESCKTPIIDLGCGSGNDTLYLLEKGKQVVLCDYSQNAIRNIQKNFPEVERTECFDMTKGLPFEDNFTDIIICDLSLHYFTILIKTAFYYQEAIVQYHSGTNNAQDSSPIALS